MTATAAEATRVKNKTANWLHNEITRRLERILGIADPINTHSVQFQLKTAWPETKTQKIKTMEIMTLSAACIHTVDYLSLLRMQFQTTLLHSFCYCSFQFHCLCF